MPSADQIQSLLACAGAFLLVARPVVAGLQAGADALHAYATTTPTAADDRFAAQAQGILHGIANGLEAISRYLPHATVKGGK